MANDVISLQGVMKNYGKNEVLKGIDMTVQKGDIFGVIGKNGCGKTTMFKLILGLSGFNQGTIKINGSEDLAKERQNIGFFIGANFFPNMSARDNLRYHCELRGIRNKKEEVERVLDIIGMTKAKGPYKNYSLGMKQRVGIGKAILGNPEILVWDEPTNGLDPEGIRDVRRLIQRLNEEMGMTIVVSSHILGELQNTCHRFGIINEGKVVRTISGEQLNKHNAIIKVGEENIAQAKQVLEAADIGIVSIARESINLEDFFFDARKEE